MEVDNCQFKTRQQFEEIFKRYYGELVIYLCKFVGEVPVAEDIVQEMFCGLWDKREKSHVISNVRAFLFRSVRNAAINYLTRKKKMTVELSRAMENDLVFLEDLETIERDRKLYELIEQLPDQRKKIFKMCFFENLPYKQVAENLNISINTIKTQMGRALADLRASADELILLYILRKLENNR